MKLKKKQADQSEEKIQHLMNYLTQLMMMN